MTSEGEKCEERAAESREGCLFSGPGRSCDGYFGGVRRLALVIRFGNWFDLLTEQENLLSLQFLQDRRSLSWALCARTLVT